MKLRDRFKAAVSAQSGRLDSGSVRAWYDDARLLGNVSDLYYRYSTPRGNDILGAEVILHFRREK